MSLVKISIMIRTPALVWSYKDSHEGDFWEDLKAGILKKLAPVEPIHKTQGRVQHQYFLVATDKTEHYMDLVETVLKSVLTDEKERASVIVSVSEPTPEELQKLKQSTSDFKQNAAFWAEAEKRMNHADATETSVKESETASRWKSPFAGKSERREEDDSEKTASLIDTLAGQDALEEPEEKEEEKPAEERLTLDRQAERIKQLREGLLSKIRGQRHAVDEVVQGIFECEMFSSLDEKRKGPLATFLFTGPSGVGKTFLASQCGEILNRPMLVVDMSEYSDNIANSKFNGNHGEAAVVTGFVRKHPNGIIVFDEVEKAHINTIHLFLQILDAGRLMDHQLKKEVSFRDNIIIMTTNAGKALYDDTTVCDLSATPRGVILEALRTDVNPQTNQPFFPECITTRMANGRVILFNHLEPFSLMEIVRDELALQIGLFERSSGIQVEYDPKTLSALVLYNGGGIADARTLRGLTRNIIVRELQEIVMQIYADKTASIGELKRIVLTVDTDDDQSVDSLFVNKEKMYVSLFTDEDAKSLTRESEQHNTAFEVISDSDLFKKKLRGVNDYVVIDPLCGAKDSKRVPNDIEDIDSEGMRMFNYVRDFSPEIPVYILDTTEKAGKSFDTLLARGAKGIIRPQISESKGLGDLLDALSFNALINNAVYSMGRSGKLLTFNCAQYIVDPTCAMISFEKLQLQSAPRAGDSGVIAKKGANNNLLFKDIIGCKSAKETLREYCTALDNPRSVTLSGKRMPKGVLFYGPPGTGKTMLAKAMANECNATFFPVSATSFFGSLVGETERNIRDIFKKARKYAPSIIFIDEVDAIGKKRIGSPSTSHNEDALNTFLAEMDGFVTDEKRPVFILAATNYDLEGDSGRVLDPAFVRRFDSKILIPLPDTDDRYALLAACLKKHGIHFGEDHERILRNMAERTGGMSNADLEMMNAQFVRMLGDGEPDRAKYFDTLDAFRFGEVNRMDPDHLRQTACHEAGHALVCRLCGTTPSFLTVVSRSGYGGFMESAGEKESTYTFDRLMDLVCRCLAGRVAEIELYGKSKGVNTGASSDIQKARYYVDACLKDFAMGETLFTPRKDEEAEALMQAQYARTEKMLHEHRATLERLSDLLAEKKSLDQNQMEDFFAAEKL